MGGREAAEKGGVGAAEKGRVGTPETGMKPYSCRNLSANGPLVR